MRRIVWRRPAAALPLGCVLWLAAGLCGCPPQGPPRPPGPGEEVLTNFLSHGSVRCGGATGVTTPAPGRGVGSAPVLIRHQHHMGGSYRLQELRYRLNGLALCAFNQADSRLLETGPRAMTVYRGRLPEGSYEIRQLARYRGHGQGVFSYLRGYKFRVRGRGRFTVRTGQPLCVDVYAMERKGTTTPLKDRPQVRLRLEPNCAALRSPTVTPPVVTPPPQPGSNPPRGKLTRPGATAPGR